MKTVRRFDKSYFDALEKTPQGFVRVPAFVTRVGVFKYRKPDGSTVRELRPPDEVFHPESLKSLALIPVTNDHPKELVNAENAKGLSIGFTGEEIKKNDKFLETTVTITDADAIKDIENGKVELSCGYESEVDETPGVFMGEPYDVIQRAIRYNHVSLVKKGRAGSDVRLKLDADDAILDEDANQTGGIMEKIIIGGKEFECSPEMKAAIEGELAKKGEIELEMDACKKDIDAKAAKEAELMASMEQEKKDKDVLQAKCDELTEQLKVRTDSVDETKVHELVQKRMKLEKVAGKILGSEIKMDADVDLELMKKVILKKHPEFKIDGKSNEYVQARFDAIAEMVEETEKTVAKFENKTHARTDGDSVSAKDARQKMIDASFSAHLTHPFAAKKKGE